MARKIVAGNWKMNKLAPEALHLFSEISKESSGLDCELIVCPPALYLQTIASENAKIKVGAQNVSTHESGAYTGEWSAEMLNSINVDYCIIGHSERRSLFGETDDEVNIKAKKLLRNSVCPIICCGETLDQREIGIEKDVIKDQIIKALDGIGKNDLNSIVIAYEPVWAIGTGVTATADQAQEMHLFIRNILIELYGENAKDIPLLYGGSCKPENAQELFTCEDIDGGLIGGASLKAESFLAIAKSF